MNWDAQAQLRAQGRQTRKHRVAQVTTHKMAREPTGRCRIARHERALKVFCGDVTMFYRHLVTLKTPKKR